MIDKWFKDDLEKIFKNNSIAVFIDESKEAEFLLNTIEDKITVYKSSSELEELHVKYLIERDKERLSTTLIYTTNKRDDLKFIREYCETCGCIEIKYLQNYIKEKVHKVLNININLAKEELVAASKVSIGKDATYWMDLSHKGATNIFDLKKELLPFIHDPENYIKKYDSQIKEIFYRQVNELLEQNYTKKPATTLANEIVNKMLEGLIADNCNKILENVYINWLDSLSFNESFSKYLDDYDVPNNIDIWKVNVNHPFKQIDEMWIEQIGTIINEKSRLCGIISIIKRRSQSKQAQALNINLWSDIAILLEFDPKDISYLSSFDECIEFYIKHFYKLDSSIRKIYSEFLNKKNILEPFQELYKSYVDVFLDKWFKFFVSYKETQTGLLQKIIKNNSCKTAIIVADGLAYELAEQVACKFREPITLKREFVLAGIPSETESNMSRIYIDSGKTEAIQNNREKYLQESNQGTVIDFIKLEDFCDDLKSGQFLICTYKDIDDMGEKLQQKALKYFSESVDFFADKINSLLNNGYEKIYLISDHGFVLTGLLSEADKITFTPDGGEYNKAERYICTKVKQKNIPSNLIEIQTSFKQFEYLYFARSMNPFKTPGLYGFSHGGLTPQEIITPMFCWTKSTSTKLLGVFIDNKKQLLDVTGELFQIKICSEKGKVDLFSLERKFYLLFFANKTQINKSDLLTIQSNDTITKEYAFDGFAEIEVQIIDADSKLQLDKVVVKKNKDRDFGGLL